MSALAFDTDADGVADTVDNCPAVGNALQFDDDGDSVGNLCDNCFTLDNADQRDTDNDGFGNRCDADLNNDNIVNTTDLALFKQRFGTTDPDADISGDGIVNVTDLALFKQLFGSKPGPSPKPQATVTEALDFGDILIGGSATGSVSVGNTGNAPLDISSISTIEPFTVFAPTAFTIPNGGADRSVSVGFSPSTEGIFSETLTLVSNADSLTTITVTGRGVLPTEPGDVDVVTRLEFGNIEESQTAEKLLTVSNTSNGPLTVTNASSDDSSFTVTTTPGESFPLRLNPGEARNLQVSLIPAAGSAGTTLSANLTLQSDDPDEATIAISLQGDISATLPSVPNNPALSARVHFNPFDLITAATCASVGGQIEFGTDSMGSNSYQVMLTDQGGASVTSAVFFAPEGAGMGTFSDINACSLADGVISLKIIATVDGTILPAFAGTPAVKNTSTLAAPVLDPLEPVSMLSTVQICGTSRANTTVRIEGGASAVSTTLDSLTTDFCLDVSLRHNTENTLIASAIDDLAVAPKPVASAQPVSVVHVDPSEIIIAEASSRPLTTEEVEILVDNGVIDLDDPSNFNVSMFTVVLTIGSFPVTITQPVSVPINSGSSGSGGGGGASGATSAASYGGSISTGWIPMANPEPLPAGTPPTPIEGCTTGCSQVVVISTPSGQTIPGVIIIDGRIKTLKEFFQVTIAIQNASIDFTLLDMAAMVNLPAGLSAVRAGLGTDVASINTTGEIDQLTLGSIAPGATGIGQFIIRGDGIGTHAVDVDFNGFLTGGGITNPLAVSGSVSTTVQVFGPPELDVVVHHPSRVDLPDVIFDEIYTLTVDITNTSNRPALYPSLEMFVGGDTRLVDAEGNPIPESNEVRNFGHIEPGDTVSASFLVQSLVEGEIIACQGLAAENITLTVDTGPEGADCNIANTFPANFQPSPADAPPTVLGINPLNGQPNIPVTTSVVATFTPESACLVVDTWSNIVTAPVDPNDLSKGDQVISANLVTPGTIFLEELDTLGNPVRHIPVDLTTVSPPAGGTTIATMRLGLPSPNTQFFLRDNTTYRATLKGGVSGICSAASAATMDNDFVWTFSTEQTCNGLGTPQATLLDPTNGAIDRPLNQAMVLTFTDRLDPATLAFDPANLGASTFSVYANALESAGDITGGTAVAGQAILSNLNRTLTYTPTSNLPEGVPIHIRLSNGLRDTCGNPLQTAANGVELFSFATQPPDTLPPVAPEVNPVPELTNLASITVSGAAEALSTVSVSGGASTATTQASNSGLFNVSVLLNLDQSNTLQVQATDASGNASPIVNIDVDGNALVVTNDSTAPAVNAIAPANGATSIPRDTVITVGFSEPIDPDTVNSLNVTVDGGAVTGTLAMDGASGFVFTPSSLLDFNRTYTVRLRANGVRDRANNGLTSDFVTTFTTENFPAPTLNDVTPLSGVQGTTFVVTFTGTDLATANGIVSTNPGISGTITTATDTQVTAQITLASLAVTGVTTLGVTTLGGSGSVPFTVIQKLPVITEIVPNSGVQGQTITAEIRGSGLTNVSELSIDDVGITLTNRGTGDADDTRIDVEFAIQFTALTGSRTVTVITDGGTTTGSFNVVANQPPLANAGLDQTVTEGDTVTLDGSGSSDPNSNPINFNWTLTSVPTGSSAALTGTNTVNPSFVADLPGEYRAELVANDTALFSIPDEVVINALAIPDTVTLSPSPGQMLTRDSLTLTATLNAPAPAGGQVIDLVVSNSNVSVPATITVPESTTSITFTVDSNTAIGSVTVTASATGFTGSNTDITVNERDFSLLIPLIGIDRTETGTLTLNEPAPTGGATFDLSITDTSVATITPAQVTISQGQTTANFDVAGGSAIGFTDVIADGTAEGYISNSQAITVTDHLIDLPGFRELALGETIDIPVLIAPEPATANDLSITITSSDSNIVEILTPTVTIIEGEFIANVTIKASSTAMGSVDIIATSSGFASDTARVQVTSELKILESTVQFDTVETGNFFVRLSSGGQFFVAPVGGVDVLLSANDSTCVSVPATVTVPEGNSIFEANITYGGSATTPCTTTVTATHPLFGTDTVQVTVGPQLDDLGSMTLTDAHYSGTNTVTVGSGLQFRYRLTLSNGNHGGVTVQVRSSDPSTALLALNAYVSGDVVLELAFANGETYKDFYVQGVSGAVGTTSLTATEPRFTNAVGGANVVAPVLHILNLGTSYTSNTLTGQLSDDAFYVGTGIPNTPGGVLSRWQSVSAAAGPLTVSLASSNTGIASLTTSGGTGGTAQVTIPVNVSNSPTSVASGGVARQFPLFTTPTTGSTEITATANDFGSAPAVTVSVTVIAASMTLTDAHYSGTNTVTVGGGLQFRYRLRLSGGGHGGATVQVTSGDSAIALVSPNATTVGSDFIDIVFANGETVKDFYVQGVPGAVGTASLTATEPRFTDGVGVANVVAPVLQVLSLTTSTTATAANDPFNIRTGIRSGTSFSLEQSVSASGTLQVLLESSDGALCQLVTAATIGLSATVDIQGNQSRSGTNISAGGVEFDPIAAGICTISAISLDFDNTFQSASQLVNVSP